MRLETSGIGVDNVAGTGIFLQTSNVHFSFTSNSAMGPVATESTALDAPSIWHNRGWIGLTAQFERVC